jgi:hypothetical protein
VFCFWHFKGGRDYLAFVGYFTGECRVVFGKVFPLCGHYLVMSITEKYYIS